ncbi:helix-turn-helix transcriptional regulator [Rhizorhabdus sp.]|uniref:helix-turn-helix domain-containing protein n=1 Tax=Rhizorhabdus sp. TaxID=1968843 RepID=UPI0025E5214F|nr:helix-turn-helix transcriptional regulator [Rhizorhabdus sp.]
MGPWVLINARWYYLSDLERGQRNPSVRALGRLANALGVAPHKLLEPAEAAPSTE